MIGSTASPSAAAPSSNGLQASIPNPNQLENGMPSANHQAQNSLALPPESDYRECYRDWQERNSRYQ